MVAAIFKKTRTVLMHLLFWIAVWFFYYYFFSYNSSNNIYNLWFSSILLPITIGITYFMERVLIPRYLLNKDYWKFALNSFYTLVVSSYLIVLSIYACLIFLLRFNVSVMPPMSKNFLFILVLVYLVVGVISFISILNQNFKTDNQNKELLNKILATQLQLKEQELHYLKRQIHPHFLFNTLNTIYGLALKQSKYTPDIILKLSNLLDYILYQINKPEVSLKEELLHIEEYVGLERMRFRDTLKVDLPDVTIISNHHKIPPMLLIPFVENAFKHGQLVNGFLTIAMDVSMDDKELKFSIGNSVKEVNSNNGNHGLGLENIKKRLEIYYSKNYSLNVDFKDNWYLVELVIFNLNRYKNETTN